MYFIFNQELSDILKAVIRISVDEKDDLFDDDYDVRGKVKGLTEEILSLKEKMTSMVGKGMIHLHLNKLDDLDDDRNDVDDVLDISDEIDNRNEDKRKHINLNFRLNRRQISEKTPCSKQGEICSIVSRT